VRYLEADKLGGQNLTPDGAGTDAEVDEVLHNAILKGGRVVREQGPSSE
jgi:hypothetical protein